MQNNATTWHAYRPAGGPLTPAWLASEINAYVRRWGALPELVACHPADWPQVDRILRALDAPFPLEAWAKTPGPPAGEVWLATGEV